MIIMGQSERSELVTNRLNKGVDNEGLRREDLVSGGGTAEKRHKAEKSSGRSNNN